MVEKNEPWATCPDCGEDTVNGQGVVLCGRCGWEDTERLTTDGGSEGETALLRTEAERVETTVSGKLDNSVCLITGASEGILLLLFVFLKDAAAVLTLPDEISVFFSDGIQGVLRTAVPTQSLDYLHLSLLSSEAGDTCPCPDFVAHIPYGMLNSWFVSDRLVHNRPPHIRTHVYRNTVSV